MNLLKPQQDSEPEEALETAMAMVASALSDSSRVSILCALMDGRAWTATELSTVAEVSACQKAQEAASAEYDKTAAAFRELEQAVSTLNEGWDMDKAIPLSKTAPDEPAAWDCKVDPDGASARARSDAHRLRSERTRYEEAKR